MLDVKREYYATDGGPRSRLEDWASKHSMNVVGDRQELPTYNGGVFKLDICYNDSLTMAIDPLGSGLELRDNNVAIGAVDCMLHYNAVVFFPWFEA